MLAEESRDHATVDWVQGLNPEGKKTICFYLPFKNLLNCAWFHGVKIFKVNDYKKSETNLVYPETVKKS